MATSNSNNSGANNSALKDVENLTRGLRAAATESLRAARAAAKLEKSMEEASNVALDKAAEAMQNLAKQSSLLEDAIKDEIKAHKQSPRELAKVIDHIEKKGNALLKVQDDYKKQLSASKRSHAAAMKAAAGNSKAEHKANRELQRDQARANRDLKAQFKELGLSTANAVKNLDLLANEVRANKAQIGKVSQDLEKPSAKIGKALEGMRSRVQDNILGLGKFATVVELSRKAIAEVWGQSVRLAGKGLVGSMMQMNMSALKLRMTAEEFEALVGSNREMVALMGGGAEGIAKFEQVLSASAVGLETLGKDGKKAAAAILAGFNRAGFGMMSANTDVANAYASNVKNLNKQFKLFSGVFGDTAEEFAALYETQLKSEALQAKLLSGDTKGVSLQMQEIMARTQTLKLMGLNNEQIKEMTKRVDATFNPRENRQSDAMMERANARMALASGAREVAGTDPEMAKQIAEFVQSGEMQRFQRMKSEDKKTYMVQNAGLFKAINKMDETLIARKDANNGDESTAALAYFDRMKAAGAEGTMLNNFGRDLNTAAAQGHDQSEEGQRRRIEQGYKNTLSDINGETTALGQSFGKLRDAVDQVTSVMGNPFTSVLTAFTAGILASSSTIRGAVSSAAGKMLKSATSFSTGVGGVLKKVLGGIGRWIVAFGLDKLFGWAGGGGNKINTEEDDANWDRMTTWEKIQSGSARGVEKAGSFFGLENITNSAQAGRIERESSYLNSQGRARTQATLPPQAAAPAMNNKSNEALMLQALKDKGILDPKQQAMLMGQLAHESGGFNKLYEGGDRAYFNKYEGRSNLGNNQAGDGYNYRGRGFIQLTGRSNYEQASKALGMDLVNNPDLAADPKVAAQVAAWYTTRDRKGGSSAELAASGDLYGLTRSINGGLNGIDDRTRRTQQYLQAVQSGKAPLVTPGQTQTADTPATTPAPVPAPATQRQAPVKDASLDELQKHTALLNTMVVMLGKAPASRRGFQMDAVTGANVGS